MRQSLTVEIRSDTETELHEDIANCEKIQTELDTKEKKLAELATICEEFQKYPDLKLLSETLLEQLRTLTVIFIEHRRILRTRIDLLKSRLIKLKTSGPASLDKSESTLDSTSMPIEEIPVHAEVAHGVKRKTPMGVSIETQTGRSLSTPTPPSEPLTKDMSTSCKPPVDRQIQAQLSEPSSEYDVPTGKQSISILKTVIGDAETIQIATKPSRKEKQPIVEEPDELLVQANYRTQPQQAEQLQTQTSELNISHFKGNQPFETVFVEPDETTTEVIVDADGTKRIIVKKLHRTLVSRKQTVQKQQLTTLSSVTDGNVPVSQSFSQVTLQDQQSSTMLAKGDGRKEILTTQSYEGKIVSGVPGGEIDVHEFQSQPQHQYTVVEETKPSEIEVEGVKLHEGDVTFVDNQNMLVPSDRIQVSTQGTDIQTSSSSVRAVVQQVTRRIIRKTRRIIRRVVIVNGKEEVTEEVVEEPEEVEITEEGFPRVSINVTKTEDGRIVEEHQYGGAAAQPEVTVTTKTLTDSKTIPENIMPQPDTERYVVEQSTAQEPVGAPITATTEAVQIVSERPASIEITSVSNVSGDFIEHETYARSQTTESPLQVDKARSKESTPRDAPVIEEIDSVTEGRLDAGDASSILVEELVTPATELSSVEVVLTSIEPQQLLETLSTKTSSTKSSKTPTPEEIAIMTAISQQKSQLTTPASISIETTQQAIITTPKPEDEARKTSTTTVKQPQITDVTTSLIMSEKQDASPSTKLMQSPEEDVSSAASKDSKKQKKRRFKNGKEPPRCQTPSEAEAAFVEDDKVVEASKTPEKASPVEVKKEEDVPTNVEAAKATEVIKDRIVPPKDGGDAKKPTDVEKQKATDPTQSVEVYLSLQEKTGHVDPAQVSMFMKYEEQQNVPHSAEIVKKNIQMTLPATSEEKLETVMKSVALSPMKPDEIHEEARTPSDIDHGGRKSKRKKKHKDSKTPTEEEYSLDTSLAESTEIVIPGESRPQSETPKHTEEVFEGPADSEDEELSETGKETGYEADKTTVDDADDDNVDKKKRRKKKRKQKVKTKDVDESLTPQSVTDSTSFGKSIEYTDDDSTAVVSDAKPEEQKKGKKKKKGKKDDVKTSETEDAKETETDGQRDSEVHNAGEDEIVSPNDSYVSISTPSEPGTVKIVEEGIPSRPASESPRELATKIISTVPVLEAVITQESTIQTSPETVTEIEQKEPVILTSAQTSPIPLERADSSMQTHAEMVEKPEVLESSSQVEIEVTETVTQTSTPEKVEVETSETAMQTVTPEKVEAVEESAQTVTPEGVEVPRSESAMQTHTVDLQDSSAQTKSPDAPEVQTSEFAAQIVPSDLSEPVEESIQTSPIPSAPPLDELTQTSLPYQPIQAQAVIREPVDTMESVSQTQPVVVKEIDELTPPSSSTDEYEVQVQASFTVPSSQSETMKETIVVKPTPSKTKPKSEPWKPIETQKEELPESLSENDTDTGDFNVNVKVEGIPQSNVVTTFLKAEQDDGADIAKKGRRKPHKKKKDKTVPDKSPVRETSLFESFKRIDDDSNLLHPKELYADVARKGSRSSSPAREEDSQESVVVSKVLTDINLEQVKKIIDEKPVQKPQSPDHTDSTVVNVTITLPEDSSESSTVDLPKKAQDVPKKKGRKRKATEDKPTETSSSSGHESLEFQITINPEVVTQKPVVETKAIQKPGEKLFDVVFDTQERKSESDVSPKIEAPVPIATTPEKTEDLKDLHSEPIQVQQQEIISDKPAFVQEIVQFTTAPTEDLSPSAPPREDDLFKPLDQNLQKPDSSTTAIVTEFLKQEQSLPSTPITHSMEFISELPEKLNKSESSSSSVSDAKESPEKFITETDLVPEKDEKISVSYETTPAGPMTEVNIHIEIPTAYEENKPERSRETPDIPKTSELTIDVAPKDNIITTKPTRSKHTTSVTIEEVMSPSEVVDVPISPGAGISMITPPEFQTTTSVWDKPLAVAAGDDSMEKHVAIQEMLIKWNQTQAIERAKNLQNARNTTHLSDVLYLATLSEVITDESIEQKSNDVQQSLNTLQEAVTKQDIVVVQQTIITTVETITTWLKTIEYRIYLNRQQTEEGPSVEKLQRFKNLKQEIANIESSVNTLQEALNSTTDKHNDDDRKQMIDCLKMLQEQVKVIENVTNEHGKMAEGDLQRWEEFINGIENISKLIHIVKQDLEELKESDASPQTKLKELEKLEIANRCQMVKAVNLISSAKSLLRDFPGRVIPQDVYNNHEITKQIEHGLTVERAKVLRMLSLAEEYEQTLKDFTQIIEIAEALVDSPISVKSLEHLEDEMQNHRKFFVNLSHCRAILESLEENLDSETRMLHSGLHQNLYQRASFILDKATGRFQMMSLAASRWTRLEQDMKEELRWLEVAQQRVPDLTSVTSADYEQYINLYQSLSLDIDHHQTTLLRLNSVAHKLQEMVNCSELEHVYTESLGIIIKLQEDVDNNLRRLRAFKETWTTYDFLSDKLELWLKGAELDLRKIEVPKESKTISSNNMRKFWVRLI